METKPVRVIKIVLFLHLLSSNPQSIEATINETISALFKTIESLQETKDSPYISPLTWETQRGMYKNEVRLNFHGPESYAFFRDNFHVPDANLFVTAWVTSCILEAYQFGKAPKPSELQVAMALDVSNKYKNRNVPYENSEMTFWPQVYNKTALYYQSDPSNLFGVIKLPDRLPSKTLDEILKFFHLYDFEKIFDLLLKERSHFAAAFHIPPDFDDTCVNIGLGALLTSDGRFPAAAKQWKQQNKNFSSVFNSVKKYAYRPFSSDQRVNTIDPRTYYYLRDFIEQSKSAGTDLALVTTWMQDTDEVRHLFSKGVHMPFNVNNVDITVASNFIYAVTMVAVTNVAQNPTSLIDADIEQIYINTTSMISHEISNNFTSRPDLALTYYPSKYEFYWFVTRTYAYLHRFYIGQARHSSNTDPKLDKMVKSAYTILRPELRSKMTDDILKSARVDKDGMMYLDDFLGNDDLTLFNKTKNRAEDRIFTTAVSVVALINTWTKWSDGQLVWESETPDHVTTMVKNAIGWLNKNTLCRKYKPWNTFFSGSGKGRKSMPFSYPANRLEFFNGTHFKDDKFPNTMKHIIGFQGHVTPAEYAEMLKRPHFGKMTPATFDGYNSEPGSFFPFWSSDAYSYAVTLLALAQYENIPE